MSDRLRIALVAEGPTDRIVIEAALRSILGSRPFVLNQLQPVGSVAFGPMGSGWSGVYRWCQQAVTRGGGHLHDDRLLFVNHDVLLLHLDADVASDSYSDGSIELGVVSRADLDGRILADLFGRFLRIYLAGSRTAVLRHRNVVMRR